MNPAQLSRELREGQSADLTRRRWIVGLSLLGALMAQAVSLYQTGALKRLPDLPLPIFDSEKVDASTYAYKRLETPDGLLMLITYGVTAALAGAGGMRRAQTRPWLPILMGAKIAYDVALGLVLAREEWAENKALCMYCMIATAASAASLPLAMPEVMRAAGALPNGDPVQRIRETLDV
ncbi:MAG TPA: vitamin K epoxide reductase family protein [Chloroflexaceae bacterium]|nr:vitamin K epoxide reductase family protein [Chloroflexaceae bacterium]